MGNRPTATYFLGLLGLAIQPALWAGENLGQLQPWWPKMPWGLVTAASAGLVVGLIVQDLYNDNSWLRRWWAARSRIVVLTECWYDEVGPNDSRMSEGYATLTFARDARALELRLWGLLPNGQTPHLLLHETCVVAVRRATRRLVIARVPIHRTDVHTTLGQGLQVNTDEPKRVILELHAGWRRQRIVFDVIFRPKSDQGRVELLIPGRHRWAEP